VNTKKKIAIEAGFVLLLSAALAWSGGIASAMTPTVGQQSVPVGDASPPVGDLSAPTGG
jgi:hypothetical protein